MHLPVSIQHLCGFQLSDLCGGIAEQVAEYLFGVLA